MEVPRVLEARGLSGDQLGAIEELERRVVAHDGGRLKLEWGVLRERPPGEVNDLLAWDGDHLVGFCGIYAFGAEPELAGAVDPEHRRRGVGTALVARALGLTSLRGHPGVLLVTPRATDAGRRFAEAEGATFHHAEHHMELPGEPVGPPPPRPSTEQLAIREVADSDRAAIVEILEAAFGEGAASAGAAGPHDLPLVVERNTEVVGALRLSLEVLPAAGVYGLAVRPDLRGQGIGRAALYEVCLEARRRGAATVTLEVEVDNDHALGLYTSVGFERRTTEDYFRIGG
ncbi:MAG TPA: GNAT family N-acetyltransferase [Acidimicrobiales bacterium]|nr:GNAT family N-acetyltransferase [Acidimicrobiales bacterium]